MVLFATQTHENIRPSRERVSQLFQQGDLVPVYRMLPADLETPVSVYLKLSQSGQHSFLLESVEGGEQVKLAFIRVHFRRPDAANIGVAPKPCRRLKNDVWSFPGGQVFAGIGMNGWAASSFTRRHEGR